MTRHLPRTGRSPRRSARKPAQKRKTAAARSFDGPALDIAFVVDSTRWQRQKRARAIVRNALLAAAKAASTPAAGLAIVLTHDSAIRTLNRNWRGKDAPTNVLSFPAAAGCAGVEPRHLGDIVIAYQTLAREAEAEAKPFAHHLAHLAVHGFLHLVGHDHETDVDAERMERMERRILATLAIPDPYAAGAPGS